MTNAVGGNLHGRADSSVVARFGALASAGWASVPMALLRTRARLGITQTQLATIVAILSYYTAANHWPSASQSVLAAQAGVPRQNVNSSLTRLRNLGLLAVRPDYEHRPRGYPCPPLRYCLQPYFCAVLTLESRGQPNGEALAIEARARLKTFVSEVDTKRWVWRVGSTKGTSVQDTVARFEQLYLSGEVTEVET
ncbi:MAG: MarR family transcriptional regulator [Actinobacteria bacterium]|nr:MarR family transcriptional regulator [Actinomycetota bacterium]